MPTATLETLEQRIAALEQEITRLKQQAQVDEPPLWWKKIAGTLADNPNNPNNPNNDEPGEMSHRESIMALRTKLEPISQEDADMINSAIREAREASIIHERPSA